MRCHLLSLKNFISEDPNGNKIGNGFGQEVQKNNRRLNGKKSEERKCGLGSYIY